MKSFTYLSLVVSALLLFSSCNSNTQATTNNESNKEQIKSTQASHYPVTITNYNHAKQKIELTFDKAPDKVLAVYQNSIETLLALGLSDKIIAASGLDHEVKPEYKEDFDKLNYLTEFAPDKETVVMMQPDFILSWYSLFGDKNLGEVDYWNNNGINTYIALNSGATADKTLENEYDDILNIGKIFDVEDKAEEIVNQIKSEVAKVKDHSSKATQKKRVLIIEKLSNSTTVYGKKTLAGDMVTKLGADLIDVEGNIGDEDIINLNPDVIFVVYMDRDDEAMAAKSVEAITKNQSLSSLDAVKSQNVFPIQLGEMYCSGIRTIDGINIFAKGIYPELY